jgi:hypothetical protein
MVFCCGCTVLISMGAASSNRNWRLLAQMRRAWFSRKCFLMPALTLMTDVFGNYVIQKVAIID